MSLLTPKFLSSQNEIKEWQTKFGQYQELFWAKGPNFGDELIVSVQCLKLPAIKDVVPRNIMGGIAHDFRAVSLFQICWEVLDFI